MLSLFLFEEKKETDFTLKLRLFSAHFVAACKKTFARHQRATKKRKKRRLKLFLGSQKKHVNIFMQSTPSCFFLRPHRNRQKNAFLSFSTSYIVRDEARVVAECGIECRLPFCRAHVGLGSKCREEKALLSARGKKVSKRSARRANSVFFFSLDDLAQLFFLSLFFSLSTLRFSEKKKPHIVQI